MAAPEIQSYVTERDGVWYVGKTRVTMHSLISAWHHEGYSAEELQLGFPALALAQVYGAIAFYLDHQDELDRSFGEDDDQFRRLRAESRTANPEFYQRLEERMARLSHGADRGSIATDHQS